MGGVVVPAPVVATPEVINGVVLLPADPLGGIPTWLVTCSICGQEIRVAPGFRQALLDGTYAKSRLCYKTVPLYVCTNCDASAQRRKMEA